MRCLRNHLADPILHLVITALILVYLTFGNRAWSGAMRPESPLAYCAKCKVHYMPERSCNCRLLGDFAHALP